MIVNFLLAASSAVTYQQSPNIIVFLVDDMGLMDTSVPFITDKKGKPICQPLNEWYRTPNMERLAQQGIRFSTFYAQSVSSPSRTSIMTGQNATRHHTTNWINPSSNNRNTFGPPDWNWQGIDKNTMTLPKMLKQAGYKTIHIGKAHFGCIGSEGENPLHIGFDVSVAGSSIGHPGSYYGQLGYGAIKGQKSHAVPGLEQYHGKDIFLSDALTLEANREIEKAVNEGKPFYLNMAHYAVHAPFEADQRFINHYDDPTKSKQAKAFATLIEGMDKSLGDIMAKLEELGVAENTLILFLGDNGGDAPLGDERGYASSAPLRGKKGTEFEGGVRIPFIASWGKANKDNFFQKRLPIAAGYTQVQLATIMDIYPTVVALADCKVNKKHIVDGVNLATQLSGKRNKRRAERFLMHFPHEHRGRYFTTFREGDWKLIYYYHPEDPKNPDCLLYNLSDDPGEKHDLSSKDLGKLKEMKRKMMKQLKEECALFPIDGNGKLVTPVL